MPAPPLPGKPHPIELVAERDTSGLACLVPCDRMESRHCCYGRLVFISSRVSVAQTSMDL